MTDTDRILELLKEHGSVTSYELRVQGFSGNPSQRMNELRERGHEIDAERFHREGRPCCRYILRANNSSSLEGPGEAYGNALQEPERAGGAINTPSAPSLLSGNGSEVEMNSPLECASVAVTSSQAEADGSAIQGVAEPLNECDAVETPVSLSLFDTSWFEQGSSPYDAEAA